MIRKQKHERPVCATVVKSVKMRSKSKITFVSGFIHILRDYQGVAWVVQNDYANVMFVLSNAEFDYRRGRGSRNRQKVIT